MSQELFDKISQVIKEHKIILFMKGDKEMPMCGFSSHVVGILQSYGVEFETVNILASEELRQGMKEFSSWPTFPQLYVNGEFIGGCDIVSEMHQNDELKAILI